MYWQDRYRASLGGLNYATSVKPAAEPVSDAEILAHLHLTENSELAEAQLVMKAARMAVEAFSGRRIIKQTIRQFYDAWPVGAPLAMALGPVWSSTGTVVSYGLKGAGYTEEVSSTAWWCTHTQDPAAIILKTGQQWPTVEMRSAAPIRLTYEVGYSTSSTGAPAWAKMATLLTGAHWFANREAVVTGTIASEVPFSAKSLMQMHRSPLAQV